MARRNSYSAWTRLLKSTLKPGRQAQGLARKAIAASRPRMTTPGDWIAGITMGAAGARRFRLYRPPGVTSRERLPLLVMLHGCGQDADAFAASTRMNRIARQHRFLVLYPEQDRISNVQGCWNWYETRNGRARAEVALIMKAIDQACLLHGADRDRIAVAGLSAGASMAALVATHAPERFKAVVMHSGVPPGTASSTATAMQAMRGRRGPAPLPAPADPSVAWPALLVIQGGRDGVVAASNGRATVQLWADAAQAKAGRPRTQQRGQRHPMVVTDFSRGRRIVASFVDIAALGHAWSGGANGMAYSDSLGPDASRLAWAFAAKQFAARAAD
ncbi:prolyl oligopeptidase family serine peptidase [Caenimonas sedimenti]|uniref:Prolyl oligopeptidase family serine peptidase n=1 Tax=Caenimonas sedimenti TaxID=2596921 RepID=A0A562ZKD5_9BURK|nr:PHB depolymerase family esterase [Caenimonas sedimenti]TWO69052.1 prolyl oligopeptidase family serine peptidase [Caenimonas sedimenti]